MDAKALKTLSALITSAADGKQKQVRDILLEAGFRHGLVATSLAEVAEVFRISERQAASWAKQGMPRRPTDRRGRFEYWLVDVVPWQLDRLKELYESDPEFVGGEDSPALERLRQAKAELAELDLQERRGTLIDAAAASESMRMAIEPMRRAWEALQRQCGDAARVAFDKALDQYEKAVRARFGPGPTDDQASPNGQEHTAPASRKKPAKAKAKRA